MLELHGGGRAQLRLRLYRLYRVPQTIEQFELAFEVRTNQYLMVSFPAELRRGRISAVLGQRLADTIYSIGRLRPRAESAVHSAPTIRHCRPLTRIATAGLRSAAWRQT